jgi:hypothetical protein
MKTGLPGGLNQVRKMLVQGAWQPVGVRSSRARPGKGNALVYNSRL